MINHVKNNIAVKCTYNNGDENPLVGFNGTCSEDIIIYNIKKKHVWCSSHRNDCKKYLKNGFNGKKPISPCSESILFNNWEIGAGVYQNGKKKGKPISIINGKLNKVALLTTVFPNEKEINRKIIGLFLIKNISENNGIDEIRFSAYKQYRIRLPLDEAKNLNFWNYYNTKSGAKWGSGLIRYLKDEVVIAIINDLIETVSNNDYKNILYNIKTKYYSQTIPVKKSFISVKNEDRTKKVFLERKYGSTGEGELHRKLKNWIAEHPDFLGIKNVKDVKIEYIFPSGDIADILFICNSNKFAVVEIETNIVLPGCFQALKPKFSTQK